MRRSEAASRLRAVPSEAAPAEGRGDPLAELLRRTCDEAMGRHRAELEELLEGAGVGRPRRLMTRDELSEHLQVSQRTIGRLLDEGLPCVRLGGAVRFEVAAVMGWLSERVARSTPTGECV